jgi:hypothetical protein
MPIYDVRLIFGIFDKNHTPMSSSVRLPNGVFQELKTFGQEAITRIYDYLADSKLKPNFEIIEKRAFGLDFKLYDVYFRVKIALKTDCEVTKTGLISLFTIEADNEVPFDIWPLELGRPIPNSMLIQAGYMSGCRVESPHQEHDYEFVSFFGTRLPAIVAQRALEIKLDK